MKILNIKKATPMFSGVIVSCDRYTEEDSTSNGIVDSSMLDKIKEVQTVVSTSEQAKNRGIENGALVALSYERYKKVQNTKNNTFEIDEQYNKSFYYEMPVILLDGREHLLIDLSDIELKIDEFEYIDEVKAEELVLN